MGIYERARAYVLVRVSVRSCHVRFARAGWNTCALKGQGIVISEIYDLIVTESCKRASIFGVLRY
jgi:hypothetical protein